MAIKQLILASFLLSVASISCKKKENRCPIINATQENLQGTWKHQYDVSKVEDITLPNEYEYLHFRGDSFYVKINHVSDFISQAGCNYFFWSDYVRGTYSINGTKLLLKGIYTEMDYMTNRTDTCYKRGVYMDSFSANFCKEQLHLEWLKAITHYDEEKNIFLNRL